MYVCIYLAIYVASFITSVYELCVGVIAVLKGNAYGHGAVAVARYLTEESGVADRLAVATISEAIELRKAGIEINTPIHVFGNYHCRVVVMVIITIFSLYYVLALQVHVHYT